MSDPFEIEIVSYTENADGGANVEFEVNKEGAKYLIGLGFLKLLEDAVKKEEGNFNTEDPVKEEVPKFE